MGQVAKFGKASRAKIARCHPDLRKVINEAELISPIDLTIIETIRRRETQQDYFARGRTKPGRIITHRDGVSRRSNHQARHPVTGKWLDDDDPNAVSYAVDIGPFPLDWNDAFGFGVVYAVMMQAAANVGVNLRSGADWDSDGDRSDQKFDDWPHFELGANNG